MSDEINVIVIKRKGRRFLYLRYECPITGERIEKSSGETNERDARKSAGEWQSELLAGDGRRVTAKWQDFTEAYEGAKKLSLRPNTLNSIASTFSVVEGLMKPTSLRHITNQWVVLFQKRLIESGRSQSTVECYCRHLKAALNWAMVEGLIQKVPKFPKLKQARSAKQMKGRPITCEEFDRMIEAVDIEFSIEEDWKPERIERVKAQRESLKCLIRGLWLSGLRLGEALSLTWDQWADGIRVDCSGKYVKLLIPAESEKGGRDRNYSVAPDFADFLLSVPEHSRSGFVFNPILYRGICRRVDTVSKAIANVGKAAKIKVDQKGNTPVWASAHDLRRAFGSRWSRKVSSMVLKELMRHASVTTTEKYYVGIQSDETSALLAGITDQPVPAPAAGEVTL